MNVRLHVDGVQEHFPLCLRGHVEQHMEQNRLKLDE
jgi:hypothetical protein